MRRLDHYLLLNHPWLWTIKLHRLLYLLIPAWVLTVYVGLSTPVTSSYRLQNFYVGGLWAFSLLSIALLVYWFYGQDSHHLEREHGQQFDRNGWREFGSYMLAIGLTLTLVPLFMFTFQQRLSISITPRALINDMVLLSVNGSLVRDAETLPQFNAALAAFGENLRAEPSLLEIKRQYNNPYYGAAIRSISWEQFAIPLYNPSELRSIGATLADGDKSALFETMSHYSRQSAADIATASFSSTPYESNYSRISRESASAVDFVYKQGFATSRFDALAATLWTLLAITTHLSLFRFLFKYAGRKGVWRTIGALLAFGVVYWIVMAVSYPIKAFFGGHNNYYAITWFLFIIWACVTMWRTWGIGRIQHFSWRRSVPAYLLPFIFIGLAYAVPALFDHVSNEFTLGSMGYIERHFFDSRAHLTTWSVHPYGGWFAYAFQFAYLPFIPYLKRQYTRLLTIPRSA